MTLGRLFRIFFGDWDEIPCPPCFLDLEVENYEEFCFFAILKSFESEKFQKDIDDLRLEYDFAEQDGLDMSLHLKRDEKGTFSICLCTYFLDETEDD